jgi:DNA-binding CsgD family transcriptional regulator
MDPPRLSWRQESVLVLVGAGLTDREIAAELGISRWTVKRHLGILFRKLSCRRRVDLAAWAARNGLTKAAQVVAPASEPAAANERRPQSVQRKEVMR